MTPLEQIREKIAGRPVAVVCPGPSVGDLAAPLSSMAPLPGSIFWAGVPKWWTIERDILAHTGQQVDFVWTNCTLTISNEAGHLQRLVVRGGLFGSGSEGRATAIKHGMNDGQIMDICPPRINAISAMLIILRLALCDDVYIFGCDGGPAAGGKLHFAQHEFEGQDWYRAASAPRLCEEADRINSEFESLCAQVGATHPTRFVNASPGSNVTIFRRVEVQSGLIELMAS